MRRLAVVGMTGVGFVIATFGCISSAAADTREELDAIVSAGDCDSASAEALPEYEVSGSCPREADPTNIAEIDGCLAMGRNALELIKHAERVCSGRALTPIRSAKADLVEQISLMEKMQTYNRGEIDAPKMWQEVLKHEKRHRNYGRRKVSEE